MVSSALRAAALAVVLGAASAASWSCDRSDRGSTESPAPIPSTSAAQGGGPTARTVHLDPKLVESAKIAFGKVRRERLEATRTLPGEIIADPDKSASIASPLAGRIQDVPVREGSVVKKGDVLVRIAVPEIGKVRAALAAATARAKAARADAVRLKGLVEKQLRPEQDWLDAEAAAKAHEAEVAGLSAQLSAISFGSGGSGPGQVVLTAPIDAVVLSRDAVIGDPVAPEKTLLRLADLSKVWFQARVFEKDLGLVRLGAPAEVVLNAYPGEVFLGTVGYVAKQVDPVARTVVAWIALENRDDLLRIGLFGTARVGAPAHAAVEDAARTPTLVVPRSAVTDVAGRPTVFLRRGPETFEAREVVVGDGALGKVEILSGLAEGDEIVVEGAFTLKSVLQKSTLEGGG